MLNTLKLLTVFTCTSTLLVACGGTTETGGAAGDNSDNTPSAVEPFVGVYDLTGNWAGLPADQAFLVIREPGADGASDVALFDVDEDFDCVFRPTIGEAVYDIFTESIFLNDLAEFDSAVISLIGTTLSIEYVNLSDQEVVYNAPRVAITELDIYPAC